MGKNNITQIGLLLALVAIYISDVVVTMLRGTSIVFTLIKGLIVVAIVSLIIRDNRNSFRK